MTTEAVAQDELEAAMLKTLHWSSQHPEDHAAKIWWSYLSPAKYRQIQEELRSSGFLAEEIQRQAQRLCKQASWSLRHPVTLYRGARNIASLFEIGQVFTERGFSSTTPKLNYAQGWLPPVVDAIEELYRMNPVEKMVALIQGTFQDPTPDISRKTSLNDAVLEVRASKGRHVLGANNGFEILLPPESQFRILEKTVKTALQPTSPIMNDMIMEPFQYTHVVSELV